MNFNIPRHIMNAGRVISAANEAKLKTARDNIDEILAALKDDPASKALNRGEGLTPGILRVSGIKDRSAEVFIYGDIGGYWEEAVNAESFAKEISELDADDINVRIKSYGGVVFDGIAIYNALVRHKAKITIHVDGIAASIASVIAMAGDEIVMSEGSYIMIHKPWSYVSGNAEDMRKEGEILDKLEAGILDIYEARTGKDRKQLESWISDETWFSAQEAVDSGFADIMVPAKKKEKSARSNLLNLYKKTPKNLFEDNDIPAIRDFERLLRDGEGLTNSQAKRVAALAAARMPRDEVPDSRRDDGKDIPSSAIGQLIKHLKSLKGE